MTQTDLMLGTGPQNGPALKAIRKTAGRTQEDIAEVVGIDQSYLSLLESEARSASDAVVDALANALDVPVDALLRSPRPVPVDLADEPNCACRASA
ncbi:helix-turn-helix transcriptional regulator [Acrocarpospora sp. B8E8]|uniref:helix-turn-helix domain-containing protein n=1 Tax=Acrocarpospora sp. B8E8 TaxID=3153572 RepID=UPI00325CE92A